MVDFTNFTFKKVCLTIFIVVMVRIIILYVWKPMMYWKNKNIQYVNPWARFFRVYLSNKSFLDSVIEAYRNYPARRYYGSAIFMQPSLFVRDLNLIKQITVRDFDSFPNHHSLINEKTDPILGLNLFSLEGEKWKDMRSTLSPAFTSSKMKAMFVLIQEKAENFVEHFRNTPGNLIELEMKKSYCKYSNDVITSCALGVQSDSLKNENNIFYKMGSNMMTSDISRALRSILAGFFPKLFQFFGIPVFPTKYSAFFKNLIVKTIAIRESNNIVRPDMIHLLLEAKKGRLQHEIIETAGEDDTGFATVEESSYGKGAKKLPITEDLITAQALVFFLAGFETVATTLSFLSYLLAIHQTVQSQLHDEIDAVIQENGGKITYEELLKMKYLDQVVSETLRMYPTGYILPRVSTKNYLIPAKRPNEVDLVLEPGTNVVIPVIGVHMDPEYFPSPRTFNPDRFSEENKVNIIPGTFMPFGSGPRNCIGSRFALLEIKALIVNLLTHFEIVPTKKTVVPIRLSKTINLVSKDGFWLGLKKRPTKTS